MLTAATVFHFPGTKESKINSDINRFINNLRNRLKAKGKLAKLEEKGKKALGQRKFALSSSDSEEDEEVDS